VGWSSFLLASSARHISQSGGQFLGGETGDIACWVRNVDDQTFQVFAINCAHLGCPVRWFPQSSLFMCPCHGGAYYEDGSRASGPPETRIVSVQTQNSKMERFLSKLARCRRPVAREHNEHKAGRTNMRLIQRVGEWLDLRLQLGRPIRETAEHPVPRETASWFYVFGSAALTCFMLQIVTGILLALIYVPSAGEAWNSLQTLNHDISLGWFIRALHGWGSNFMVAIVLIHMVQVFPSELTSFPGNSPGSSVFSFTSNAGNGFYRPDHAIRSGRLLGIRHRCIDRKPRPLIGPWAVNLMLGGPIIAGATLSRFFAACTFSLSPDY